MTIGENKRRAQLSCRQAFFECQTSLFSMSTAMQSLLALLSPSIHPHLVVARVLPFSFLFFKRREFALSRTYQIISGRGFSFLWYLLLLTIYTIVIPTHYILIIFFPFSLAGCWRMCVDIDVLGIEHNRACHNRGREKRELMLLSFDDIKGIENIGKEQQQKSKVGRSSCRCFTLFTCCV